MNAIIYLLQVSACLALFYGFYYLMLNRLTFFTINRYYLLCTLILSFIIPLLTISVQEEYSTVPVVQRVVNMRSYEKVHEVISTVDTTINATIKPNESITWMQLLQWSYWVIACALLVHLLITLVRFFAKLKHRKMSSIDNVNVLRGDKKLPNGSFLNYIFINNDELSDDELQQIIAHEMLHVKLFHSVDRMIAKIAQIVLWFNPFVYLYVRSIEENHEFEVDREITRSTNKTQYADLLLHLSVAKQGMLYHNFSKVPLKKRIVMLFNQPSAKIKKVLYILVLPVILLSCLAFAKIKNDNIEHFSFKKTSRQILTAIKAGQDNIIVQLNKPILSTASVVSDNSHNTSTIIDQTKVTNYSVFGDDPKNALVIIDGKEYSRDILFKISKSCMAEINVSKSADKTTYDIRTKNGKITYMTTHEIYNLRKERSIPETQFYTRLSLTDENGVRYDHVVLNPHNIRRMGGTVITVTGKPLRSLKIPADHRIAFNINGQVYNENELKEISPGVIASLHTVDLTQYPPDKLYQNKYNTLYTLTTPYYDKVESNNNNRQSKEVDTAEVVYTEPIITKNNYTVAAGIVRKGVTVYKVPAYKVEDHARLNDLIVILPNFKIINNEVFIKNKKVTTILVNGKTNPGGISEALMFPAVFFDKVEVLKNNAINFLMKPEHKQNIVVQHS